jgi:ribosome-associated protein
MIQTIVNPIPKTERALQLALAAADVAAENRGQDILVLDMRKQTALFDYFVIATGSSRRQIHAMSEEIDHKLEDDLHDKRMSVEGYDESKWIVLDYGSIVVHLFDEETRQFYSLENLWADSQKVSLEGVVPEAAQHQGDIGFGSGEVIVPGEVTDGEVADGEVADGEVTDGEVTDGEVTDGEVTDGEVTDGETVEEG